VSSLCIPLHCVQVGHIEDVVVDAAARGQNLGKRYVTSATSSSFKFVSACDKRAGNLAAYTIHLVNSDRLSLQVQMPVAAKQLLSPQVLCPQQPCMRTGCCYVWCSTVLAVGHSLFLLFVLMLLQVDKRIG
jgi:hypothetical protein